MTDWITIPLIVTAGFLAVTIYDRVRFRLYWQRACTGASWKRRFPHATKKQIRVFLSLFVSAFGFSEARRLKFSPDDKIIDIYRILYPLKGMPDGMEMEIFAQTLEKKFGVNVAPYWHENITLGELFEHIIPSVSPTQSLSPIQHA